MPLFQWCSNTFGQGVYNLWVEYQTFSYHKTMKDVRRVMKIRKRERTRALDEREELETEEKITSLSNLKQELIEEQSKLQREVEIYRIMEFLNSPSDQQWMKQLLTHSNWQHWYKHITGICIAANCFLLYYSYWIAINYQIILSFILLSIQNMNFHIRYTSAMYTKLLGKISGKFRIV